MILKPVSEKPVSSWPVRQLFGDKKYWSLAIHENPALIMQIAFLLFLLSTVNRVWKLTDSKKTGLRC